MGGRGPRGRRPGGTGRPQLVQVSGDAAVSALLRAPSQSDGEDEDVAVLVRRGAMAAKFGDDRFHHAVQVLHHIRRGKPDHPHASAGEVGVAAFVSAEFAHVVRPTVYLDGELLLKAVEVHDPRPERMLSAEAPAAGLAISERLPQPHLGRRHGASESPRSA